MKVELHILQNFPPANLNRDDTGSPKDCEFGGVRRARVSSQCLKRRIRNADAFHHHLKGQLSVRTKRSAVPLAEKLVNAYGFDIEAAKLIAERTVGSLLGWDEKKETTKVLFYVGPTELDELAVLIHDHAEQVLPAAHAVLALSDDAAKSDVKKANEDLDTVVKKAVESFKKEKGKRRSVKDVDIALFGRMLAEAPVMNIDAACQVAHAISTNKVDMDFDYFTAVDDLNMKEETGAGMIGTTGFNASCFYRYALIDADQLAGNLESNRTLAKEGILGFIAASIEAIPTGKQNSFAAQTPPSLVMAVVRPNGGMPWSLVNAFVKPMRPRGDKSLVETSISALDAHWDALVDMYGDGGARIYTKVLKDAGSLDALENSRVADIGEMLNRVSIDLDEWIGEGSA